MTNQLSLIQKLKVCYLKLRDDQSASYCLGKFLSLLSHLTDLETESCSFHDDFYKEIADRASLSQIQKLKVSCLKLRDDQSASYCLGKFLSLLSHLTDLETQSCSFHDDFYKEIADRASLSQIQKLKVSCLKLRDDQSASYCLGKFLSLLSHLTDLETQSCSFHDDFYKEIADRASSSQIQTVQLECASNISVEESKQLAKFLCSLPWLTNLKVVEGKTLHDDFFAELNSFAASSQQPYFREKKHVRMLRNWSARKRNRQKRQQRQRNQCETQHSPHHGLEEATQDTAVSQRQEDATPIETDDSSLSSSSEYINSQTSVYQGGLSIGIKPIYENDDNLAMPSTSGLSSAQSRTDAGMEIRLNNFYRPLYSPCND
ncbi:uncharacterized protein LOC115925260 [Strongylocentrotus purpuratus]|uniref:Uncharacterized protein n=1 Tax=Strongylocentrotus purpuratus TaxID=7668 RepID=A0A7M7P1H7_STRPU|nr:uncharacterized protein LOC115925260 [Strongylocentrotus purpuratus]